jgi:hypothetical protein
LASCFLTWQVKILHYSPVWRVSWKTYSHHWWLLKQNLSTVLYSPLQCQRITWMFKSVGGYILQY